MQLTHLSLKGKSYAGTGRLLPLYSELYPSVYVLGTHKKGSALLHVNTRKQSSYITCLHIFVKKVGQPNRISNSVSHYRHYKNGASR